VPLILCSVAGKFSVSKELQPSITPFFIVFKSSGNVSFDSETQSTKVAESSVTPLGIVISVSDVQCANAADPKVVNPSGSVTFSKLVHPPNAYHLIVCSSSGSSIAVNFSQSANAFSPISINVSGSCMPVIFLPLKASLPIRSVPSRTVITPSILGIV